MKANINILNKTNMKNDNSTKPSNCANRVLAPVIDSLSEAIEKANVKITFGIQDWQIKRIGNYNFV